MIEAEGSVKPEDLRPNVAVLCAGSCAVALISAFSLPWPAAIASITLGALMIAGADVDARTYLLPDIVTCGLHNSGDSGRDGPRSRAVMAWRRNGDCASCGNSLRARAASLVLCPVAGLRRSWFRRCETRGRRRGLASDRGHPSLLRGRDGRGFDAGGFGAAARREHQFHDETAVWRIPLSCAMAGFLCGCRLRLITPLVRRRCWIRSVSATGTPKRWLEPSVCCPRGAMIL
jgi:hypothetical protein